MQQEPDYSNVTGVSQSTDNTATQAVPEHHSISRRRLWLFRLLALTLVPTLILVMIELILGVAGVGFPTSYFLPITIDEQSYHQENPDFGLRFFPKTLVRRPKPCLIPASKAPATLRVFVLGGSAAMGDPDASYGLSAMLAPLLRSAYPNHRIETYNAAMTAINSHVVRVIAEDAAELEPDVLVVYVGNNEVVGPYGPGTVMEAFSPSLETIRAGLAIRSTRLSQSIESLIHAARLRNDAPGAWGGMQMFLDNRIRHDDPRMQYVYNHYRRNLNDIIQAGISVDADVVLCTVAVNLRQCAPFSSLHREDMSESEKAEWDSAYDLGITHEDSGDYQSAVSAYLKASEIDDHFADLHFRLAQCYRVLDNDDAARTHYIKARDLDALRFRADSRLNQIVREVVEASDSPRAHLVDTEALLNEEASTLLPGEDLFYDHVHLNFRGNYLTSVALLECMTQCLDDSDQAPTTSRETLSEESCRKQLVFSPFDEYRLCQTMVKRFQAAPFTKQLDHQAHLTRWRTHLGLLRERMERGGQPESTAQYWRRLSKEPDSWLIHRNFAYFLQQLGRHRQEAAQWRAVLELLPHYVPAMSQIADCLRKLEELDEAEQWLEKALTLEPENVQTLLSMGILQATKGDMAAAERYFKRALAIQPDFAFTHFNLGSFYLKQREYDLAKVHLERYLKMAPENANAMAKLGETFRGLGQIDRAIEWYRKSLAAAPRNADVYCDLGDALRVTRDEQAAIEAYREAIRINPGHERAGDALTELELIEKGPPRTK